MWIETDIYILLLVVIETLAIYAKDLDARGGDRTIKIRGKDIKYDKRDSPHGSDPTEVKIGIYINTFYSISEQTMDYSVNIYFRQTWYEPRLAKKDKRKKGESGMIKLADGMWSQLWVPDTTFRNEKKAAFHDVTIPNRLMRLYDDGKIWYAMKLTVTLSCPMNLAKYPMDTQFCPIMIESFGYTKSTLYFNWWDTPVATEDHLEMPQFRLIKSHLIDCSQNYSTGAYPCLQINFELKRDLGYYIIQIYMPSWLIVILSWVGFWINVDAVPARVTIGLLTVLTTTTQSSGARSSLPRVSYIKAIDVWMSVCLIFVFSSLLEYAVVNVMSRKQTQSTSFNMNMRMRRKQLAGMIGSRKADNMGSGDESSGNSTKQMKATMPDWDGKRKARMIDKRSRKIFPCSFLLFNIVYWVVYGAIMKDTPPVMGG
ncbi:unnamed protein product [Owenia fusiformis]|uniref:Uncharacterized protein n=1 Tax=Owenia fusiformis TaxID=6347 RepID=A0A8J1YB85_OWEFU|nr:unnamed protein product [Owenia fusiformis]